MSLHLVYTSAPRGLEAGTHGFCTVAASPGIAPPLLARLEALSAYRFTKGVGVGAATYSHVALQLGGATYQVISRIGPSGADYSGRSNFIAHHILLDQGERPAGGPAAVVSDADFFERWEGPPRWLDATPPLSEAAHPPQPCGAWAEVAADAGWAGRLCELSERSPAEPVYIIYPPGVELLPLFREAIALLPPERRWAVTFTTCFSNAAPDVRCQWRGIRADASEVRNLPPHASVIHLAAPLPPLPDNVYIDAARRGTLLPAPPPPSAASHEADAPIGIAPDDPEPPAARRPPPSVAPAPLPRPSQPGQEMMSAAPPPPPSRTPDAHEDDQPASPPRWHLSLKLSLAATAVLLPLSVGLFVGLRVLPDGPAAPSRTADPPPQIESDAAQQPDDHRDAPHADAASEDSTDTQAEAEPGTAPADDPPAPPNEDASPPPPPPAAEWQPHVLGEASKPPEAQLRAVSLRAGRPTALPDGAEAFYWREHAVSDRFSIERLEAGVMELRDRAGGGLLGRALGTLTIERRDAQVRLRWTPQAEQLPRMTLVFFAAEQPEAGRVLFHVPPAELEAAPRPLGVQRPRFSFGDLPREPVALRAADDAEPGRGISLAGDAELRLGSERGRPHVQLQSPDLAGHRDAYQEATDALRRLDPLEELEAALDRVRELADDAQDDDVEQRRRDLEAQIADRRLYEQQRGEAAAAYNAVLAGIEDALEQLQELTLLDRFGVPIRRYRIELDPAPRLGKD